MKHSRLSALLLICLTCGFVFASSNVAHAQAYWWPWGYSNTYPNILGIPLPSFGPYYSGYSGYRSYGSSLAPYRTNYRSYRSHYGGCSSCSPYSYSPYSLGYSSPGYYSSSSYSPSYYSPNSYSPSYGSSYYSGSYGSSWSGGGCGSCSSYSNSVSSPSFASYSGPSYSYTPNYASIGSLHGGFNGTGCGSTCAPTCGSSCGNICGPTCGPSYGPRYGNSCAGIPGNCLGCGNSCAAGSCNSGSYCSSGSCQSGGLISDYGSGVINSNDSSCCNAGGSSILSSPSEQTYPTNTYQNDNRLRNNERYPDDNRFRRNETFENRVPTPAVPMPMDDNRDFENKTYQNDPPTNRSNTSEPLNQRDGFQERKETSPFNEFNNNRNDDFKDPLDKTNEQLEKDRRSTLKFRQTTKATPLSLDHQVSLSSAIPTRHRQHVRGQFSTPSVRRQRSTVKADWVPVSKQGRPLVSK